MEFNSSDVELIVLESSDESSHENGDIMMLEELYRQEEFMESLQQFIENELSKLDDSITEQADVEWIRDFTKDSSKIVFNSDNTFSSTFVQESTNYENSLQLDEDEFIDLILENKDVMLVDDQSFVDCGTIDYNDYEKNHEFQMDPILTEYLATVDSSLDPLGDFKLQCKAQVCLERLPEPITKIKDTFEVISDQRFKFNGPKKSVLLYCHKCEKFEINSLKVSMPKNCQDCGNLLIYLCKKCKEKYFTTYSAMGMHRKTCRSKKTTAEIPTSLFVYDCQDCDFRTLNKNSVDRHVKKTRHRLNNDDSNLQIDKKADVNYTRQFEKVCSKVFKRFCKKCNEIISSTSDSDGKLCKNCGTPLFYCCIKCNVTSKSYKSLVYHLKHKCLSRQYKCSKCDYTTFKWKLILQHTKQHHSTNNSINCQYCDYVTHRTNNLARHQTVKHNVGFSCKICNNYTTLVAERLKKHILRRHYRKKDDSETFECTICRRYSANDRDDLWLHIEQRHCEK